MKTHFPTSGGNQWAADLAKYTFGNPVGNVWWVNSVTGQDTNGYGFSPDSPFATLDYAISAATASNHDHVILMPGHTETYTTTGTKATLDIAGLTVIGLGSGSNRPTFTFSHTGATFVWSAAGVTLKNILLVTGVDSVVTFCTISGADATLEDIEARDTTDVEVIDDFTTTAGADRLTVIRYYKNGYTGGNANVRVFKLVGTDGAVFKDCRFITKVTTAVINFTGTACTGIDVSNCLFLVTSTTDFSKNVVDTITGSTWAVRNSFDLGAGASIGGGSGAAVGTADVSTITDALYGATGIVSWPAAAAPANGVSLAEGLRWLDDAVQGAAGVVTFPAAAAPANGVSLAEVLRAIYDRQLGDGTNAGTNGVLGKRVTKTTADTIDTSAVPLFSVAGGRVIITAIYGEVTTIIQNQTTNSKLQFNPTTGTTNDLCANLDIDADEAGTLYSIDGTPATAMLRSESGAVRNMQFGGIICDIGDVEQISGATSTGSIQWTAWYLPLDDGATLAAA